MLNHQSEYVLDFEREPFGYRVWFGLAGAHWCDFRAYEVSHVLDGIAFFKAKDEMTSTMPSAVHDVRYAEPEVFGYVKRNGCCEFDSQFGQHFCGARDIQRFHRLQRFIFEKAQELMGGDERWVE